MLALEYQSLEKKRERERIRPGNQDLWQAQLEWSWMAIKSISQYHMEIEENK